MMLNCKKLRQKWREATLGICLLLFGISLLIIRQNYINDVTRVPIMMYYEPAEDNKGSAIESESSAGDQWVKSPGLLKNVEAVADVMAVPDSNKEDILVSQDLAKNDVKDVMTNPGVALSDPHHDKNNSKDIVSESVSMSADAEVKKPQDNNKPLPLVSPTPRNSDSSGDNNGLVVNTRNLMLNTPTNINIKPIRALFKETCSDYEEENLGATPNFESPWFRWDDVLLIVAFNNPFYDNIPYNEVLYRPFFPHILYCGPQSSHSNFTGGTLEDFLVRFVAYQENPVGYPNGSFHYECMSLAIQLNYTVQGYLLVADDMIAVPSKLKNLRKDRAWYVSERIRLADIIRLRECNIETQVCDSLLTWTMFRRFKDTVVNALETMESQRLKSKTIDQCLSRLMNKTGGPNRVYAGYSDIFYVPRHIATGVLEMVRTLRELDIYLAIAVPTILNCLTENEILPLQGEIIWKSARRYMWKYFTSRPMDKTFIHPTKWGYITEGSANYRNMFCAAIYYLHDKNA